MATSETRTANVLNNVDPDTREQAETILNKLGIPMSNAIEMYLKQVVLQQGIPFEIKLPESVPAASSSMTKEQKDNLKELIRLCRQSARFNYKASDYYIGRNKILGTITIFLSAIVSSALLIHIKMFINPNQQTNVDITTIVIGVISCIVTVLSILQMFLNYSELAEKCKRVSARYVQIRRELQDYSTRKSITESDYSLKMNSINTTMTLLAEDSPHIPEHIQKEVKEELKNDPIQHPLFSEDSENSGA